MTHSIYPGLQRDGVEGMEYLNPEGLVVSGPDVTGTINALYVVNHSGVVLDTALLPAIQDQDHLGANSLGGDLHVLDTNDPTNGYSINKWIAPFSENPTLVGIYNGPNGGGVDVVDLAFFGGRFYTSGQTGLYRYVMSAPQSREYLGSYNYSGRPIWGIAAVAGQGFSAEIPALKPAGLAVLAALLAGMALWQLARRSSEKLKRRH